MRHRVYHKAPMLALPFPFAPSHATPKAVHGEGRGSRFVVMNATTKPSPFVRMRAMASLRLGLRKFETELFGAIAKQIIDVSQMNLDDLLSVARK